MNAVAKIEPRRSVIATLADSYGMEAAAFEATLRGTVFPSNGTREEFAAFVLVAKEYKLNPLLREIYAFPKKGGGIVPIVGIDGWLNLINTHQQFDGMDFEYRDDEKGNLVSVTCSIFRKDRSHPTVVTEYLDECIRGTEPWKMKRRMLRHKAAMQCARYAFGFSGIYDEDEAQDIAQVRDVAPPPPPPEPTAALMPPAPPIEDATFTETAAEAAPPKAAQDAEASLGNPAETASASAGDDEGIDPEAELENLAEQLAVCQDAACIEDGYAYLDVEAELGGFDGYVEKARALKAEHLARVAKLVPAGEPESLPSEEAAPPPPPADGDDGIAPAPPADEPDVSTLDGYRAAVAAKAAAVATKDDYATFYAWWESTRSHRNTVLKITDPEIVKELQSIVRACRERVGA